jgi:hypothetical protein
VPCRGKAGRSNSDRRRKQGAGNSVDDAWRNGLYRPLSLGCRAPPLDATDFDTNLSVANRIRDLWSKRWPIEELAQEQASLQRATLAEVQAAAKQYTLPSEASFVLVGDRS